MTRAIHPVHAVLLAGMIPLFLGVLICDIAYGLTYELQWKNFASWLIVGGLVPGAIVLVWSVLDLRRARGQGPGYFLLLLVAWVLGFSNASVHARDAWASMPAAVWLSGIVLVLAIAATTMGFARPRVEVGR